jgi:hypothetical protein
VDYLKEEQYYNDLYDLLTIKRCLDYKKLSNRVIPQKPNAPPWNKLHDSSLEKDAKVIVKNMVADVSLYFIEGEEYRNKSETINGWMRRDQEKDERLRVALTPENICCDYCSSIMNMTLKELHHDGIRVMFWFECPRCKKRKAIFDSGEKYKSKPNLCPRCSCEINEKFERKREVLTTFISCPNCKYRTKEIWDFEKDEKEWMEKEREDVELLKKYRWKFCMSEKQGSEYLSTVSNLDLVSKHFKETEQKEADPTYHKAKQLKKLNVTELEKLLSETLEKEKYVKLSFDKPEIDKYVVIPFTVQDSDPSRDERSSTLKLQKVTKNALEFTNWRLMSEGTRYRLGYVYGRLKGYEREEDLMEIVRKRRKDIPLMETENGPMY